MVNQLNNWHIWSSLKIPALIHADPAPNYAGAIHHSAGTFHLPPALHPYKQSGADSTLNPGQQSGPGLSSSHLLPEALLSQWHRQETTTARDKRSVLRPNPVLYKS